MSINWDKERIEGFKKAIEDCIYEYNPGSRIEDPAISKALRETIELIEDRLEDLWEEVEK